MRKVIGFKGALELLMQGHPMVHERPLRTTINGLTIVHPGFHYLIPYCSKGEKQKDETVVYAIKKEAHNA